MFFLDSLLSDTQSLTLLVGVVIVRFFPETLLLRMRLKLCRRDFFKDLTLDRGPSIAKESLGCKVHLGEHKEHHNECKDSGKMG